MAQSINEALKRLESSRFRSSFHLNRKDREYIADKGMEKIRSHAYDFVNERIRILREDDGSQTPMKNHPVFKAMHATGCCCRGCLEKWYRVDRNRVLSDEDVEKIVHLLMAWIEKEIKNSGSTSRSF